MYLAKKFVVRALTVATVVSLATVATVTAAATTQDLADGIAPADLAELLAGEGVSVSNVVYVGAETSAGTFAEDSGIFGFASGVVLSSGNVDDLVGPNDLGDTSVDTGAPGDVDLSAIAGVPTYNAAVLSFDFVPNDDAVYISYVFASEEYNEYANSAYNDVFAFFVNGTNCALTESGDPVSVNTINGGNPLGVDAKNAHLFINNDPNDGVSINIEPDGFTVTLICEAAVTAGATNTMTLAIADGSDAILDSWVLLSEGGVTTVEPENCFNGVDDDGDGAVDSDDSDCGPSEADPTALSLLKFYDADADGVRDDGEPGIADWQISFTAGGDQNYVMTGEDGSLVVEVDPGAYVVTEGVAAGWMAVGPTSYNVEVAAENTVEVAFGNVCIGAGGAHTKGYWQNKNGESTFSGLTDPIALLAALPLENADALDFDPDSYSEFRGWLRSAKASTPSYMLSAQLAAMVLSVDAGHVAPDAVVYAPAAASANEFGFTTVSALLADALHSLEDGSDDLGLSDALDMANSNESFVQPGPASCAAPVFDAE